MLMVAAALIGTLGIAHSVLGERYIITWLLRHDLPRLFGTARFAAGTIRFAWHVTTVLALGFAAVLVLVALDAPEGSLVAAMGWTFLVCALLPLYFTRARHLSWIIFLVAGILCLLAAGGL